MVNSKILAGLVGRWHLISQQGKHYEVNDFWTCFVSRGMGILKLECLGLIGLFLLSKAIYKSSSCRRTDSSQEREEHCSESLEDAVQLEKLFPEKWVTEAVIFKRIKGDKLSIALTFAQVCVLTNRTENSWNYKNIVH